MKFISPGSPELVAGKHHLQEMRRALPSSASFKFLENKPRKYSPNFLGIDPIIPITLVTLTNGYTILTLQNYF